MSFIKREFHEDTPSAEIGVGDGDMIVESKGLHGYAEDIAKMRCMKETITADGGSCAKDLKREKKISEGFSSDTQTKYTKPVRKQCNREKCPYNDEGMCYDFENYKRRHDSSCVNDRKKYTIKAVEIK